MLLTATLNMSSFGSIENLVCHPNEDNGHVQILHYPLSVLQCALAFCLLWDIFK